MSTSRYAEAYKNATGAGDARPTAMDIINDEHLVGKLVDKTFLVTGCTSGIGIETAKALHATGATVYITGRKKEQLENVAKDIMSAQQGGRIETLHLDLTSLENVRASADEFLSRSKTLNVLINNAGIMAPPLEHTTDGFESQYAVCHLAHFLLTYKLLPTLLASSTPEFPSRVVNLSSTGHRGGTVDFEDINFTKGREYAPFVGYGQAKTANIWHANQLERLFSPKLHATSVMPGGIDTGLQKHASERLKELMKTFKSVPGAFRSAPQGAATTVLAAVGEEFRNRGGVYLENCEVAPPFPENGTSLDTGYKPYAYEKESEERLWKVSCEQVGVPETLAT